MRGGPIAILFAQCLSGGGGDHGWVVRVAGMGQLVIERRVSFVSQPKQSVPARPGQGEIVEAVKADAPVCRSLQHVPRVVTRAGGQSGSEHPRAVRALPDEFGTRRDQRVHPAIEHGQVDAEARVDLRHLRNLPPREWGIPRFAHPAEPAGDAVTEQQVANQRFPAHAKLVGQGKPRSDRQLSGRHQPAQLGFALGAQFEIVEQRRGLRIEMEVPVFGLGREDVQQHVHHLDELLANALGGVFPFAVPMGVGHEVALGAVGLAPAAGWT
jgi:hypothetical protein